MLGCSDSTGPANEYRSQISVISTSSGSVADTYEMGDIRCNNILLSPDGSQLFVWSYYGDEIVKVNSGTGSISGSIDMGYKGASDVCVNDAGTHLYALTHMVLYRIGVSSMKIIDSVELGMDISWEMARRPGTDFLYIPRDELQGTLVLDAAHMEVVDTLSFYSEHLSFSEDGEGLYICQGSNLVSIDPGTGQQLASVGLPGQAFDACRPAGSDLIYASWCGAYPGTEGGVAAISADSFLMVNYVSKPLTGSHLCHIEPMDQLYVSGSQSILVLDLESFETAGQIDLEQYIYGMAASPDGAVVYCPIYFNGDSGD